MCIKIGHKATEDASKNLELWTHFWAFRDHDLLEVEIQKVKAHATEEELETEVVAWSDFVGNPGANRFADKVANHIDTFLCLGITLTVSIGN